jgi:hypothetical protein
MLSLQNRILPSFIFLLILAVVSITAVAQTTSYNHDPVYGYDPLLYNGRMYVFYQPGTGGTQYLFNDFDTKGSITLRGVTYTNLSINYDIYNQQLILKYKDAIGSPRLIEISFAWLESFTLNNNLFEIYTETDSTKRIYQVLGSGDKKILFYHQKELLLHNQQISGSYYFSKGTREKYVLNGNKKVKFNNNRSFISVFSLPEQELLKKYIRQQNINVKKTNDYILNELINYCKTLGGT